MDGKKDVCSSQPLHGRIHEQWKSIRVGGLTTDMNSDAVDIYDIATDSFDYTVISQARQGIVSAVLKDDTSGVETLMLIGGTTFGGKNRWLYEGQSKHSQRIDFLMVRTGTRTMSPRSFRTRRGSIQGHHLCCWGR